MCSSADGRAACYTLITGNDEVSGLFMALRFGDPATERTRRLLDGAVRGIGYYGNCVGVANIGGEVRFDPGYEQSCLVNAMCIGVLRAEDLKSATAAGIGNLVVLFGARTGRDGIGGASVLASQDIDAGGDELPVDEVAASAGTLGYELLCALSPRVPVQVA